MAEDKKLHLVMFPWLAFGHMIPFLELSKLIAQKGHRVSFVSTPRNIDRLPKLPANLTPYLTLVKLPLGHVDGLPDNAEATIDVPYHDVQYLKKAYDGLKDPMMKFLEASKPDYVIHDFASYWIPSVTASLDVPTVHLSILTAAATGFLGDPSHQKDGHNFRSTAEDFTVSPPWVTFPSTVAFRLFEIQRIFDSVSDNVSGVSDYYRVCEAVKSSDIIAVRSCSEFEPEWLNVLREIHRKPVIPVGQLPSSAYNSEEDEKDETWMAIKDWLDMQSKGTVVYVAFGSEAKPSQDELTEIALGLELSGLAFFWVLRTRRGSADTELIELPDGFEERTKGRGVVCKTWAPQLKILSHDSVGGFLTHSGWSSVVEALCLERALILLTFLADQGLNARLLEDRQIAYAIPRNERDGSFTRDSVAESLGLVMLKDEGKVYRERVKEMKGLFGDRHRQDRFVGTYWSY